ncbi:type IV pilus modification protein PilV [Zoogloeaceae bacteirum Par-f-2]|jgi:type IV pilus assembly protein PilV|uniref:type IV pilus modification protein PilV n=1 Tax=Pseudothauera hydrothermalis TaxID=2184083 RepID=UPI000C7BF46C|nr:type IV pilus modification protein PilV [Pseudothauera hydrothermalis]AUM00879.1 type IV pilus modification protein PilV [Rhodocyclaceae bacterium]AVZ80067.1 type IV pilus modification protein PilV [Zoogloeaceae bacteirum Par-f-2]
MQTDFARPAPSRLRRVETGFSLLEVLIAVLVLAVGLLGMAALQINALKNNQSSFQRTQAVMLSYYMLDAMRANRDDVASGNYDLDKTCEVPASAGTLVSNDHHFWLQAIKDNLGDAQTSCGEIACQGMTCTVTIFWSDDRGTGGAAEQSFSTSTQL